MICVLLKMKLCYKLFKRNKINIIRFTYHVNRTNQLKHQKYKSEKCSPNEPMSVIVCHIKKKSMEIFL